MKLNTNDRVRTTRLPSLKGTVLLFGIRENAYLVRFDRSGESFWYSGHELEKLDN